MSSPFDILFLPEIWARIRDYACGPSKHFYCDDVTEAMIALTCRAEFARMRDDKYWFEPFVWFWHATERDYRSVCRWVWNEFPSLRPLMFFDGALVYGYFALAEELRAMGAPLRPANDVQLAVNNKLEVFH